MTEEKILPTPGKTPGRFPGPLDSWISAQYGKLAHTLVGPSMSFQCAPSTSGLGE